MRFFRVLLLVLLFTFPTSAQGAPDAINDALADLSTRLGRTYTLNDLFWTWEQTTFLDSALGCPQRGEITTQGSVIGYIFKFTVGTEIYEYRVSADRTKTRFCGTSADGGTPVELVDAIGIDSPEEVSNRLCPPPIAPDKPYIRSRLAGGIEGRIASGGGALNLRDTPSTSGAVLTQVPELARFSVIANARPACDSAGYVWWQVNYNGTTGYLAEGLVSDYFIEPAPPASAIPATAPITAASLPILTEAAKLQGNFQSGAVAWSRGGKLAVLGESGAEGLWIYDSADWALPPRQYRTQPLMVRVAFGTGEGQSDLLVLGSAEGTIHLWDISPASRLTERLVLNGHDAAISAVALAPTGGRIASSGGLAFATTADDGNRNAVLVWDINTITQVFALRGHTDTVTAAAFNPNGTLLATASLDKTVRLWDMSNGQQSIRIDADSGVTALAFSPDGALLAVGFEDGTTLALSLSGDISAGPVLNTHNAAVSSLVFTPDNATLISVGLDSALVARPAAALFSGEDGTRFTLPAEGGDALALSPDGAVIAVPLRYFNLRLLVTADNG